MSGEHDFEWLVIGSGFGGSVSALRLAEKGYRVAVLESGRRYEDEDRPRPGSAFYRDPQWSELQDWETALEPH